MPPKLRRPAAAAPRAPGGRVRDRGGARAPGGRVRDRGGARRRPGLREEGEAGEGFDLVGFDRGITVEASLIPLEVWKKGLRVVVVDGSYWEEKVSVAGVVQQVVANGEEVQL